MNERAPNANDLVMLLSENTIQVTLGVISFQILLALAKSFFIFIFLVIYFYFLDLAQANDLLEPLPIGSEK